MQQKNRNYYTAIGRIANKRKLTIAEIERMSGLSQGIIGKWKISSPSVDNLIKVADTLGVTVNKIIKEAGTNEE